MATTRKTGGGSSSFLFCFSLLLLLSIFIVLVSSYPLSILFVSLPPLFFLSFLSLPFSFLFSFLFFLYFTLFFSFCISSISFLSFSFAFIFFPSNPPRPLSSPGLYKGEKERESYSTSVYSWRRVGWPDGHWAAALGPPAGLVPSAFLSGGRPLVWVVFGE